MIEKLRVWKVTRQPKPQLIGAAIDKKEETLLSDDCF
jgi:hypothetical protein